MGSESASPAARNSSPSAHAAELQERLRRIASRIAPAVRACVETGRPAADELRRATAAESARLALVALQRWQELRETYSNDAEPTWSRLAALSAATQRGFYNQAALLAALEAALKEEAASSQ